MIPKSRVYWLGGVAILTVLVWIFMYPDYVGICPSIGEFEETFCIARFTAIVEPVSILLSGLLLSFVLAITTADSVFRIWKKFSYAYMPFAVLLIFLAPNTSRNILGIDREFTSIWLSILYVIISLVLITYKSWRIKRSTK